MFSKKCTKCDKVIEGYTQKQVDWLMGNHDRAKHAKNTNK